MGLTGLETGFTDALLRVAPLGRPVQAARLTPGEPLATVAVAASRGQVWATYFRLGVSHIVFGFDHLLYVVWLVLLIGVVGVAAVIIANAGFNLGFAPLRLTLGSLQFG